MSSVRLRGARAHYKRRAPEDSVLYGLVAAEAEGLREAVTRARDDGRGLPKHVDKELDALLECGLLSRGFARVRCRRCRKEHLVAFSCKGRGLCPSCCGRRMDDTAAHLVDRVLPYSRYRQWVVTFSRQVRYYLASDPKLAAAALDQCLHAIFAWQRKQARRKGLRPSRARSNAAVAFVQRFNSALELSLHFHILIPDAVFIADGPDPDARPRLHELDEPTNEDVTRLLDEIMKRVTRLLDKRGLLGKDAADNETEPHLLFALGPARASAAGPFVEEPLPRLCARKEGFSLHAGRAVERNDREGLERLCRYGLRPALAQGRLSRDDDGTILYQMKRRFSDGRQVLRFEPQDLLLRLCALIPPPRFHMVRYAGLFAPHARGRRALTGRGMHDRSASDKLDANAAPTSAAPKPPSPREPDGPDDPTRPRRLEWAALLKRTMGLDVLQCPDCGHRMELIATIEDRLVAHKILAHLGLPTRPPPKPPPWCRQRSLPFGERDAGGDFIDPPALYD